MSTLAWIATTVGANGVIFGAGFATGRILLMRSLKKGGYVRTVEQAKEDLRRGKWLRERWDEEIERLDRRRKMLEAELNEPWRHL